MKQFIAFVKKEYYHIFRDRRTMLILLVMPIILMVLFGYAITTEVKNSRVAIYDPSRDEMTSMISERIDANGYLSITHEVKNIAEAERLFKEGKIDLAVIFSDNFADEMKQGGSGAIQLLADGSEPNQASIRTGYAMQVLRDCMMEYAEKRGLSQPLQITPETRFLFNPQSKSEYNFVPGVIGLILMLICCMMTGISIVREKEQGTMEILLVSPLSPLTIVLAKLVPYFTISCINLITILLLSSIMLHIPVAGSLLGLAMVSFIYIIVALSLGLLISTLVSSQLAAMLISLLLIIPTIYLSDMVFPVASMPEALQRVSSVIPARWYIDAIRRIMIQGVEMRYVLKNVAILTLMAVVLLSISWKLFKTKLE
ncbi:MAG: ABC transporter permease [Lepagella sp.]